MNATADQSRKGERETTALADRVAVVTGASSGIGAGLAAMLAAEGARVVLAARRGEQLEAVAAGIRRAGGVAVPVVTPLVRARSRKLDGLRAHQLVKGAIENGRQPLGQDLELVRDQQQAVYHHGCAVGPRW